MLAARQCALLRRPKLCRRSRPGETKWPICMLRAGPVAPRTNFHLPPVPFILRKAVPRDTNLKEPPLCPCLMMNESSLSPDDLLQQFDQIFGLHPGFRPAHAKGLMLTGTFTPDPAARTLTRAPHFTRQSTPVTVRFSNSTGLPEIPDNAPDANPARTRHPLQSRRARTYRYRQPLHRWLPHPRRLRIPRVAARPSPPAALTFPLPSPLRSSSAPNPTALAFVQTPKPFPTSFATETYFGVTAFAFTNDARAQTKFGRYRIVPEGGQQLSHRPSRSPHIPPNYHFDEIAQRVANQPVRFQIRAPDRRGSRHRG